jgi:hypothetical protein
VERNQPCAVCEEKAEEIERLKFTLDHMRGVNESLGESGRLLSTTLTEIQETIENLFKKII